MVTPRRRDPRWDAIALALRALRKTPEQDVTVEEVAAYLRWDAHDVAVLGAEMQSERLVETDAGMGELPTIFEGR